MNKQGGISLIELMVAMLISVFLLLGVTQVYLDNKESYLFQQNQGSNVENARFSILILEQELSKTGYRRRPDETMETAFPKDDASCGGLSAGQVSKKISDTSFCIRYQAAFPNTRGCDGNLATNIPNTPYVSRSGSNPPPIITETFKMEDKDPSDGDTAMQLTCNGEVIASNIQSLSFEYGVNDNDEKAVKEYTKNPTATANIRAVKFSVLTASARDITKEAGSAVYEYWFNTAPTDKKLYTMLSTSSSMRNLMP
ncbi:PilW family protein [Pseudomonas sp. F(2018)]|uniref:PilW family protein n=1 Tax=Pseudomonas sp. F(2018) TaxID=2502240 RepID=UPI0010F95C98|nr:PilW family protein [Pseudomonas sp. F(2018)]